MPNRALNLIVCLSIYIALLTGCSTDQVQIVEHPSKASPGDTFTIQFVDFYLYLSNTSYVLLPVKRDSIHVLAGLPDGWSVISADFYAQKNFKISSVADLNDTAAIQKMIRDSIAKYSSSKASMKNDPTLVASFSGRQVDAHNGGNDSSITVSTDSVKQWFGFSAPLNINYSMGSKLDTAIDIDTLLALAGNSKFLPSGTTVDTSVLDSLPINVDTVGISMVPIVAFVKIKTGSVEGNYKLYYYSKTGPLPDAVLDTSSGIPDMDIGDMVYTTVSLGNASVISRFTPQVKRFSINAYPNPFTANVQIDFETTCSDKSNVRIFSSNGRLMKSLVPTISGHAVWDGTDIYGRTVHTGSYLIQVKDDKKAVVKRVELVR